MDLYIIRHAWAAERGDPRWPDDEQRPLTDEGQRRFARMVEKLAQRDFDPQSITTSPLVRCRQTAELVRRGVPGHPEIVERDELRPGSDLEGLLAWTIAQGRHYERIAWVGHAPDVGLLAAALLGQADECIRFAKGAVAAIRFSALAGVGRGELRWLVTARVLGC